MKFIEDENENKGTRDEKNSIFKKCSEFNSSFNTTHPIISYAYLTMHQFDDQIRITCLSQGIDKHCTYSPRYFPAPIHNSICQFASFLDALCFAQCVDHILKCRFRNDTHWGKVIQDFASPGYLATKTQPYRKSSKRSYSWSDSFVDHLVPELYRLLIFVLLEQPIDKNRERINCLITTFFFHPPKKC
uniref:Uncharacterized protein n=1 Tax=Cucumis sativus TaxID=3659 RepID=A0A0A0K704_CUCSA